MNRDGRTPVNAKLPHARCKSLDDPPKLGIGESNVGGYDRLMIGVCIGNSAKFMPIFICWSIVMYLFLK